MQIFLSFILTMLLLSSCNERPKIDQYYRFSKQITPSGKYVIYDYARYGPAFGSDISGMELFKIDEMFEEGAGISINGAISEWITDDTLLVYNFKSNLKQPKDTLPIKIVCSDLGDFVVKTIFYKTNAGYRSISDFDSVSMTKDSIFIRIIMNSEEKQFLVFPLGATTISTRADSIIHIEVSGRLSKNMNFVYKNEDGTFTSGLPEIATTWYDLTPAKRISFHSLNRRKVFWQE